MKTMGDLISRNNLYRRINAIRERTLNAYMKVAHRNDGHDFMRMKGMIEAIDAILLMVKVEPDAEERKKGRWIFHNESGMIECSECHEHNADFPYIRFSHSKAGIAVLWDFCPDCGADMREDDE